MIKKIQKNGYVSIPKQIRQQLPSNTVNVAITTINGKKVVVIEPVGEDKKPTTIYE